MADLSDYAIAAIVLSVVAIALIVAILVLVIPRSSEGSSSGMVSRAMSVQGVVGAVGSSSDDHAIELLQSEMDFSRVVYPWDPAYESLRHGYNTANDPHPIAIVLTRTDDEVIRTLAFLRRTKIPFCLRGLAHSFAPQLSSCSTVIIDQRDRKKISVDPRNKTVTIEPGIDSEQLKNTLWKYGFALPTGTCYGVGVMGLALGGGIGFLTRTYGVTSDNMRSAEIVLADGRITSVDQHQNSDLFWALRGAGHSSFGIVTSMSFNVHPINMVLLYELRWPRSAMKQVIDSWQRMAPFAADIFNSECDVFSDLNEPVLVTGQFMGSEVDLRRVLQPLLLLDNPQVMIWQMTYDKAADHFADKHLGPHPFRNRSSFVRRFLPAQALQIIERFMNSGPKPRLAKLELNAFGGKVDRIPSSATAFPYRQGTLFWMLLASNWLEPPQEDENVRWVNDFYNSIRPYSLGAYADCPDLELATPLLDYYGPNLPRLIVVKRKYDPEDVFHSLQSIPT